MRNHRIIIGSVAEGSVTCPGILSAGHWVMIRVSASTACGPQMCSSEGVTATIIEPRASLCATIWPHDVQTFLSASPTDVDAGSWSKLRTPTRYWRTGGTYAGFQVSQYENEAMYWREDSMTNVLLALGRPARHC